MDDPATLLVADAPVLARRSPLRWWIHLLLLLSYPLVLGVGGFYSQRDRATRLLPDTAELLLMTMGIELLLFVFVFGLAWWASRATSDELLLTWRDGWRPVFRGFVYSIGLRLLVVVAVFVVAVTLLVVGGMNQGVLDKIRPRTEQLVLPEALVNSPAYLLLNLTLVSFVVAGLREELWRAAVLAGLTALYPRFCSDVRGKCLAISVVAVVFGLGHLPQGWGGVGLTTVLGAGLGAIMIYRRSIWEAVLAHGFFDATTFLMLYLLARFRIDALLPPA